MDLIFDTLSTHARHGWPKKANCPPANQYVQITCDPTAMIPLRMSNRRRSSLDPRVTDAPQIDVASLESAHCSSSFIYISFFLKQC